MGPPDRRRRHRIQIVIPPPSRLLAYGAKRRGLLSSPGKGALPRGGPANPSRKGVNIVENLKFTSPFSANVILAKARAMYGNSLKVKDFNELLHCHSVSEVAAYLKNSTAYASVLAEINESTIHRGHLEMLIRRKAFNDYAALGRYDIMIGMNLSLYLLQRIEIEQIIACLRYMSAGHASEFFFSMPMYFASHTRLDLPKMSHCASFAELLEALAHTKYHDVLAPLAPKEEGRIRLTEIENALYTQLTNTMYSLIAQTPRGMREELTNLFGAQVDAQNVTRILRLKRYFQAKPAFIRENLLPGGRCLSPKVIDSMVEAPTADAVLDIFRSTALGRRIPPDQREFIHDLDHRAPYFNARKHIHYSIHPLVVLLSYVMLTDVEVDDIINIIEGIRYGLDPDQIRPMLVLAN